MFSWRILHAPIIFLFLSVILTFQLVHISKTTRVWWRKRCVPCTWGLEGQRHSIREVLCGGCAKPLLLPSTLHTKTVLYSYTLPFLCRGTLDSVTFIKKRHTISENIISNQLSGSPGLWFRPQRLLTETLVRSYPQRVMGPWIDTSHALEKCYRVIHEVLEAFDVTAFAVRLAMTLVINPKHSIPSLCKTNSGSFHKDAAFHGISCHQKITRFQNVNAKLPTKQVHCLQDIVRSVLHDQIGSRYVVNLYGQECIFKAAVKIRDFQCLKECCSKSRGDYIHTFGS